MEAIQIKRRELKKADFTALESSNDDQIRLRNKELMAASRTRSGRHNRVIITFLTKSHGVLSVEAEVVSVTEKYAVLKGSDNIPLSSIVSII